MSAAAPQAPRPDDDGWVRVHPASPWVRGWTAVLAGVFVVGRDVLERGVGRALGGPGADDAGGDGSLLVGAAVAGALLVVLCLLFLFSWWFTRFRLGPEEIELRRGWLLRSRRQMRYDRIQAVDLQHPLLARLLGLAAVKVEAADGGESALELSFLRRPHAEAVRREILDRASGVRTGPGTGEPDVPALERPVPRPEEEGEPMLRVPAGRLVASVLLSWPVVGTVLGFLTWTLGAGLALSLLPSEGTEGQDASVTGVLGATLLPLLFAVAGVVWSGLNAGWGFEVRRSPDGLRLRHGLTDTVHQTVPPGRVQGVTVSQSLFWRPLGWYRVTVSVAGYDGDDGSRGTALPVGPWEDVLRVLTVVAPEPGLEGDPRAAAGLTPAGLMHAGLHGAGAEHGFRPLPRRARLLHPLAWRRIGFTTTRTLLLVRRGRWDRSLQAVQHERVQAASLRQGPLQRRLRLCTVTAAMAGTAVRVPSLDEDEARELFALESRFAAVSRRLADRDHWMAPEELARFDQRTREVAATEVGRRELARAGVAVGPPASTPAPRGAGPVPQPAPDPHTASDTAPVPFTEERA